ncbi:MAG: 2-hydroxyacid dehydrogenase [Chloroflexi bacterium]|nr:2-hydroxyacid dehydrogenase [Chloroflexota bacterium]
MKALILAPFSSPALEKLRAELEVAYESWLDSRRLYSPEELAERLSGEDIAILVVEADFVFEETFEQAPRLKFLGVCRGNPNNVDVDAATRHGVLVAHTPGRNAPAVAEMALALMLCLARRIPPAHQMVASGAWEDPTEPYISLRGLELGGKTLGLVGLGAIGAELARRASALGMKVLAHDPYVQPAQAQGTGVALVDMETLLRQSDFLSLHCPATDVTRGLIDKERLALMKPSAYLINTADAALIDEEALADFLKKGRLAGAGLDVFPSHPVAPDNPLLGLDNVVLTPHIGGATQETIARHSEMIAEDILHFLRGERPAHLLNPQAWGQHGH